MKFGRYMVEFHVCKFSRALPRRGLRLQSTSPARSAELSFVAPGAKACFGRRACSKIDVSDTKWYLDIMKRTVISLEDRDKAWLDEAAAREGTAATELVRRAVKLLRERESLEQQPFGEVLRRTSGLWRGGDGLDYQTRLRDEW